MKRFNNHKMFDLKKKIIKTILSWVVRQCSALACQIKDVKRDMYERERESVCVSVW
jgi:hypothetical protein